MIAIAMIIVAVKGYSKAIPTVIAIAITIIPKIME